MRKLTAFILFVLSATCLALPPFGPFWGAGQSAKAADPTYAPSGYTSPCGGPRTITISTVTIGANIRYTTNGSTPSYTVGTLISSNSGTSTAFLHADTTFNAIAFIPGVPASVSNVVTSEYDFSCG